MSVSAGTEAPYSGLVTIEEFQRYLSGININEVEAVTAAEVLLGTQQELETYLNRPVQVVQIREYVQADSSGIVTLSITPVWKIIKRESVSWHGMPNIGVDLSPPYTPDEFVRDDLLGENDRMVDLATPGFGAPVLVPGGIYVGGYIGSWWYVEYVGGYNGHFGNGLKLAIMRVAAREFAPKVDETLSLRGPNAEKASEPDTRQIGWTDDELAKWDRLRRRVVA